MTPVTVKEVGVGFGITYRVEMVFKNLWFLLVLVLLSFGVCLLYYIRSHRLVDNTYRVKLRACEYFVPAEN